MTAVVPGFDWTVVLRRQPARIVAGRPEGGYSEAFEIICCDCGDEPELDYRDVSLELQRIRGPYPIAAGVTAYEEHLRLHGEVGGRATVMTATPRSKATHPPAASPTCPDRTANSLTEPARMPISRAAPTKPAGR